MQVGQQTEAQSSNPPATARAAACPSTAVPREVDAQRLEVGKGLAGAGAPPGMGASPGQREPKPRTWPTVHGQCSRSASGDGATSGRRSGDTPTTSRPPQPTPTDPTWDSDWLEAIESLIDNIVDHEFYAAEYASKEQPQAEGLLQTLHDSLQFHEQKARSPPPRRVRGCGGRATGGHS